MIKKDAEFFKNVPHERHLEDYIDYLYVDEEFDPNGKKILLVGGGNSPIFTDLVGRGYWPKSVTNVDPYASPQNDSTQILHVEDFLEYKIFHDSFDEIWALYSLPFWLEDIKKTDFFLAHALLGLAPNGNFRIYPVPLASQIAGCLDIIKKFVVNFYNAFPNAQCKFKDCQGTDALVFHLPQDKGDMNEWLQKNYIDKRRSIIDSILDAF
jgi:hypothetical protein